MPTVNTLIVTGPVADRSRLITAVCSRRAPTVIRNADGSTFVGREFVHHFDIDKVVHQPPEQADNWNAWRTENWGTPYNAPAGAAVRVQVDAERYIYSIPIDGVLSKKVIHTLAENFISLRFELKIGDHQVVVFDRGVIVGEYTPHAPYDDTCHECGNNYDSCRCDADTADEDDASDDPLEN